MGIETLNSLDQQRFVGSVGWVFEHSPWVAERTWFARPFADIHALFEAMKTTVENAERKEQLALLRAHPDLGTRARISAASTAEQTGAGLDQLTAGEFDSFRRLNESYRNRFGFPFLFAVRGKSKHDILTALERRLSADPENEFQEALQQVYRIAEFRLREMERLV
jgi:OHCU decarboxylase